MKTKCEVKRIVRARAPAHDIGRCCLAFLSRPTGTDFFSLAIIS
jgi:hypothetical protein